MPTKRAITAIFTAFLVSHIGASLKAGNWPTFRGPNADGISPEVDIPVKWSDRENLTWKVALPGYGSSSPIIYGERIYITCYSGYGLDRSNPGDIARLKRHLLCLDRTSGKTVWEKIIPANQPEDPYRGFITEHGYASNSPVTDGKMIYVFFGKSGAYAFDMKGTQMWHRPLGTESTSRRWGSAASPVLYKDLVIVNASEESRAIYGLDQKTGQEKWKVETDKLAQTYTTPVLAKLPGGREQLIVAVPNEIWGLDPASGEYPWYARTNLRGNVSPCVVADGDVAYVTGGRPVGSFAIKLNGSGDVTDSHMLWTTSDGSYVPSPVLYRGHLYWVSDTGYAFRLKAKTGERVYRERVVSGSGKPFYAAAVLSGNRLYAQSRTDGCFVLEVGGEYKLLSQNEFASDSSDFNGTPAISDGQIFIRSNTTLYCIGKRHP